ncbi:MAG: hypothetical protein EBY09_15125 [Verrucomicrobia bacterium]|nr:hypothetical protein [Verrucomicrobiota bacterium]
MANPAVRAAYLGY